MRIEPELKAQSFVHFRELVRSACGLAENADVPRQVTYLESYLKRFPGRPARTIVVEQGYVDRHYLEEFTGYYATMLDPPASSTVRLHFFSSEMCDEELGGLIHRAASGELESVRVELQNNYLGFSSIRPIASAPIGRTLLVPYRQESGRQYGSVIQRCSARLAGVELGLEALPFQQQDLGVGACASASLWSALSKASRGAGMRAPTPFSVTAAATKNWVTDRAVPAVSGLELGQIAGAVREFGFAPYTVKVNGEPEIFLWTLKVYLRSGIPAVLVLRSQGEVHAVTVAGHKESQTHITEIGTKPRVLRYGSLGRVYVHDDRIGPYVKMKLHSGMVTADDVGDGAGAPCSEWRDSCVEERDDAAVGTESTPTDFDRFVGLEREEVDDPGDLELTRDARIDYAIFPLYPKLRLTAAELAELATAVAPLLRQLLGPENSDQITVEARFLQNGDYIQELYRAGIEPARLESFVRSARLSRYVGLIRWELSGEPIGDVVCDTTDVSREGSPYDPVIAVFFFDKRYADAARDSVQSLMRRALVP